MLLAVFAPLSGLQAQLNYATPYTFSEFAGAVNSPGLIDATGTAARFSSPTGMAVDSLGNYYVADSQNQCIRKITPAGEVTVFAGVGGPFNSGSVDGPAASATFYYPSGVAVDASDNLYVTDTENSIIRKISGGVVSTLAGTAGLTGSTDGTGAAARFNRPVGLAVDSAGNVFVADTGNNTIRMITPGGVVTTFAGTAGVTGEADGTGAAAQFYTPFSVAVNGAGTIYVADANNHTIRAIDSGGVVTTLAGLAGFTGSGSADGTGSAARFATPLGLALDGSGDLYVTDSFNQNIRLVTPGGTVTTIAGSVGVFGSTDGIGNSARFNNPEGLVVNGAGDVYIADVFNCTIRKMTPGGTVTTFAGTAPWGSANGTGSAARFYQPSGAAVDISGNVYIADSGNNTIRKITSGGAVTTLAGTALTTGSNDGTGAAAQFNGPIGVAVDGSGNVYVADAYNYTIRKITAGGVVTTLAGEAGVSGSSNGVGIAAHFTNPTGVAVDGSGNVYVADDANSTIRKITSGGLVTTLAGTAGVFGHADGTGPAAQFAGPYAVAVDGAGNVYVSDFGNDTIRKVTPGGVVTTLAGSPGTSAYQDGTGSGAWFASPSGLAIDSGGYLYVADNENRLIRKVSPAGVVTTLAGDGLTSDTNDGTGQAAHFLSPVGIAVDSARRIYVVDNGSTVRKGVGVTTNDFNGDGHADILWQNTSTGERGFWLMNGTTFVSWVSYGAIDPAAWRIAATADFNGDGSADILWENISTGERGIWLMNGTTFVSWYSFGIVTTDWRIAGAGDFNGDGSADIVWENTTTGERGLWLMNGTTFSSWLSYDLVPVSWNIAAVADFNGDGQTDLLWENTVTGDRGFWLMNGTTFSSWVEIGIISTDLRIATAADFNGDGKVDILWQNTVTGKRVIWFMNGTTFSSSFNLGTVSTDWSIAN